MAGVVFAQDTAEPDARGIIPIPTTSIGSGAVLMNPLFCQTELCDRLSPLLFPSLVNSNPVDGSLQLADDDNFALVAHIEPNDAGDGYIYTLRDDATWSDGTPITAYDVFFSYLAAIDRSTDSIDRGRLIRVLDALMPLNASQVLVIPDDMDCDVPLNANFSVIPVAPFDSDFATRVDGFFGEDPTVERFDEWTEMDTFRYWSILNHDFSYEPTLSYGNYQFVGQSAQDFVRLTHVNQQQVLQTVQSGRGQAGIDDLMAGDIAYYLNVPHELWDDFRHNPNINTVTMPTNRWYFMAFNFTDRTKAKSYRDRDGDIQAQDPHPILVNPDVRRAIQLGIDVQAIVDTVLYGEGDVLAGYSLPYSWTHNPDLDAVGYDPDTAKEMLEGAGWRQISRNGARTCIDCGTTDDERALNLSLLYHSDSEIDQQVAALIARQLSRIGVQVDLQSSGNPMADASLQTFDLYLDSSRLSPPFSPRDSFFFLPENDVIASGSNVGSYLNPDLAALYEDARTVDGCDLNTRRDLYFEIEQQVQQAQPFVWLFTPYELHAFHTSIQNIETYPNQPIANIEDWSIWRMP